ncbi:hypothetical protein FNV43_RR16732 [Rhamnella rubrinervis]|uniref:DUF1985 domain-containing protein n=1 Tax=Rhamnella rubrinervis TaxID=2594499 RepID=A0A8K0GZB8_9ROSA|nr:hypothetical protein FNV43_RR16732 [Rhamnella rubrinervis]
MDHRWELPREGVASVVKPMAIGGHQMSGRCREGLAYNFKTSRQMREGFGSGVLVLSGGIIHNMIARQADSLNTEVMEFNFNDKDKDDMVKLTLIYSLECGILGKESQVGINEQHLSMVEDLNYFNQYAWGLESYNATIISMHRALGLRQGKLNESATYSLCGFPLAFQVWGYETIPLMGDLYANKVGDSFPRICNWEDKGHTIFFKQVGIDIFGNNQLYVIGRLRAINADEESIYEQNENCPIPPLEQYVNEGPTNFDHEHEGFSYYHQQQHASNVEIPTINDFARPSTSSHYQYHPGHHDTHMHDATEDVAMGDEGGALDLNMNMVDDDYEVQYVTPSKMVQRKIFTRLDQQDPRWRIWAIQTQGERASRPAGITWESRDDHIEDPHRGSARMDRRSSRRPSLFGSEKGSVQTKGELSNDLIVMARNSFP